MIRDKDPKIKEHETWTFLHKKTQVTDVTTYLTQKSFRPADERLTHLLFMNKWESLIVID